jgi:hypothetical protein
MGRSGEIRDLRAARHLQSTGAPTRSCQRKPALNVFVLVRDGAIPWPKVSRLNFGLASDLREIAEIGEVVQQPVGQTTPTCFFTSLSFWFS